MHKHYHTASYPPSCFDDDFCLKPPILLWLSALFLSRGIVLPAVIGVGHVANVTADAMAVMRGLWRADDLIPTALATPVLYALVRRVATASRPVRWLWAHGRGLLALSAAVDLALSILSLKGLADLGDQSPLIIGACIADLYFLVYVLAARRCRDSFSDFPSPAQSAFPAARQPGADPRTGTRLRRSPHSRRTYTHRAANPQSPWQRKIGPS